MNNPIFRNSITITRDEAVACLTLCEKHHFYSDYTSELKDWIDKNLPNDGILVTSFHYLPTFIRNIYNRLVTTKDIDDFSHVLLINFFKKLRPCQLLDDKTSITIPKEEFLTTFKEVLPIIKDSFDIGTDSEAFGYEDKWRIHYLPSYEQVSKLYYSLTQYLLETPEAPVNAQSLRKKAFKVMKYISFETGKLCDTHGSYKNPDERDFY